MFSNSPNATCNNALFSVGTIEPMTDEVHESASRLYEAAKKVGVEGKSAVARLLNESPQVVNNWERRGVSEGGALKAQEKIGCNAVYILTGQGQQTVGGLRPEVLEIAAALSRLSEPQIKWAMRGIRFALESAPLRGSTTADAAQREEDEKVESPSSQRTG